MIRSSSVRRLISVVAAGVLVLANLIAAAAFLSRPGSEQRRELAVRETPSWRVETGWDKPEGTATAERADAPDAASEVIPSDDPAEIVTPEQIRAANRSPCSPDPDSWVDVRRLGAKGDGRSNDSSAIQKANDAVAARGGGRVIFPAGIYRASGIEQGSCVAFVGSGKAAIVHPDGGVPDPVIEGRNWSTRGAIQRNSRVLTVRSTAGLRPGAVVAVQAAGGRSRIQRARAKSDVAPFVQSVTLNTTAGLQREWRNYLYIENELISYNGISGNTLLNVERGQLGTQQEFHPAGAVVAQAQRLYAMVVRVQGNRVILDHKSGSTVQEGDVRVGVVGPSVVGLVIDGNRRNVRSSVGSVTALSYRLARWVTVRNSTMKNGPHGGVSFDSGTRDSVIEDSTLTDNGDAGNNSGSAIWLFRGAQRNVVRNNTITGQSYGGIWIDDRTASSTEYDSSGVGNRVEGNTIDIPSFGPIRNAGVVIDGSYRNDIVGNVISNARTGVMVARTKQGTIASIASSNKVWNNRFIGHDFGIHVSGSDNEFAHNEIREVDKPWDDSGQRNRFIDNAIID